MCYCPCHLWRALPYSAAPTVCIRLAGSLPIECCARSHMGSLYSVSEGRGSIYVIVQPDFLYALYILINGRLEASGIESVLVCFTSLPTTPVTPDIWVGIQLHIS